MATGRIGTTPVLTTRWSKAPSAGTTSLSGLDDNSVSLVYSVGYEAVYQNGVLLSRGNDYTATNGTTITLTTATVAGDIIEVFANQLVPLTDTYSQTVANGKFINNTLTTTTGDIIYASAANTPARLAIGSTNQVLTVSGGVPTWATPASGGGMTLLDSGSFTGASVTTATLSTSYNDLYVVVRQFQPVSDAHLRVRFNGDSAANYSENGIDYDSYAYSVNQHNEVGMGQDSGGTQSLITFTVPDYANTSTYKILFVPAAVTAQVTTPANAQYSAGRISAWKSTAAVTSLTFFCSTGNFTAGSYRVYGVK